MSSLLRMELVMRVGWLCSRMPSSFRVYSTVVFSVSTALPWALPVLELLARDAARDAAHDAPHDDAVFL